jgi:hypothetical protein
MLAFLLTQNGLVSEKQASCCVGISHSFFFMCLASTLEVEASFELKEFWRKKISPEFFLSQCLVIRTRVDASCGISTRAFQGQET